MSVDYTRGPGNDPANTDADASMFAPTPIWDKSSRRRRGARARPSAPIATGAAATDADFEREEAMSPTGEPIVPPPRTAPAGRGSIAPAAIVVGVLVLAALAAAGWYATRSNSGMAQITPGAPAGSTPATAITPNAGTLAANTTPPSETPPAAITTQTTATHDVATTPARTTTVRHRATRSSTVAASPERSVTSTSATGAGVNTGAIAPAPRAGANPPLLSMTPPSSTAAPSAPATAQPPPIAPAPSAATPSVPNTATSASATPPGDVGTTTAPPASPQ